MKVIKLAVLLCLSLALVADGAPSKKGGPKKRAPKGAPKGAASGGASSMGGGAESKAAETVAAAAETAQRAPEPDREEKKAAPPAEAAKPPPVPKEARKLSSGEVVNLDVDNFEKDVHDHKNVWVVLFTSPDKEKCPHCDHISKVWSDFTKATKGVKFGTTDASTEKGSALATALGVFDQGMPNVRLFNGDENGWKDGGRNLHFGEKGDVQKIKNIIDSYVAPRHEADAAGFFEKRGLEKKQEL
jgi:hypothetical protein